MHDDLFTGRATLARNRGFANRINLQARGKKEGSHKGIKAPQFSFGPFESGPFVVFIYLFSSFFFFTPGNDSTSDLPPIENQLVLASVSTICRE